jgi:hypothetical protein
VRGCHYATRPSPARPSSLTSGGLATVPASGWKGPAARRRERAQAEDQAARGYTRSCEPTTGFEPATSTLARLRASQLRYVDMEPPTGAEPVTSAIPRPRSFQLSYGGMSTYHLSGG